MFASTFNHRWRRLSLRRARPWSRSAAATIVAGLFGSARRIPVMGNSHALAEPVRVRFEH